MTRPWFSKCRLKAVILLACAPLLPGCSTIRGWFAGADETSRLQEAIDAPDPEEYVLVRNPRYSLGATSVSPYEPEYVWVKRKDAPFDVNAFVRGKKVLEAPPKDEERFAGTRPPEAARPPRPDDRFFLPPAAQKVPPAVAPRPAQSSRGAAAMLRPAYGYVVLAEGKQVYTDLGLESGAALGDTLIIYQEGQELRHPVTGALLGRADQEVARALITEVRDKVAVAKVTALEKGDEVRPGDRVKLIRAQ